MKKTNKIEMLIGSLPENFAEAVEPLREIIIPQLLECEQYLKLHYFEEIKKRTRGNLQAIEELFHGTVSLMDESNQDDIIIVDPDVAEAAERYALNPQMFKSMIDYLNLQGVCGERMSMGQIIVTINSRMIPDVIASMLSGHHGGGKSKSLFAALKIFPSDAYFVMSSASNRALYGMGDGLKHKALIIVEAQILTKENRVSEAVRTLISEGFLKYHKQERVQGKWVTVTKNIPGPTSMISTTIRQDLEKQLRDRLFTIHPDVSDDQTARIMKQKALSAAVPATKLDKRIAQAWQLVNASLEPLEVVIPFAPDIVEHMDMKGLPISARRAFERIISAIKTVTIMHHKQREVDGEKRLIAQVADYATVYQLFGDSFLESIGEAHRLDNKKLRIVEKHVVITPGKLAQVSNVKKQTITDWIKRNINNGVLAWCDENGKAFEADKDLARAKNLGQAYLKVDSTVCLPSPFELTGDPDWDKGGRLYEIYREEIGDRFLELTVSPNSATFRSTA